MENDPSKSSAPASDVIRNVAATEEKDETVREILKDDGYAQNPYKLSLEAENNHDEHGTTTTQRLPQAIEEIASEELSKKFEEERELLDRMLPNSSEDIPTASVEFLPEAAVRLVIPTNKKSGVAPENVGQIVDSQRVILEENVNRNLESSQQEPFLSRNGPPVAPPEAMVHINHVRWWLYLAEFFGRWGDRMWSFTAALFLAELFPGTMLLPAIHGLVTGSSVILSAALIGEWVDATQRLRAVRTALLTQNSCVALGSLVLTFAFVYQLEMDFSVRIVCVVIFMMFAVLSDCASVAMNIIIEKDWIIVMSGGNKKVLADLNATIRRIDLTCQILSPIIIAQIMTFSQHYVGTIVVSLWNLLSMMAEYSILLKIYKRVPTLSFKLLATTTTALQAQQKPLSRKLFKSCFAIKDGWTAYFKTRIWPAGVGLAFLYMTVLAFGGVTNTYILTQGLSESIISIAMAFGAVFGIAGTFAFPKVREKVGLERTGLFAMAAQFISLTLCVISIWFPGSPFDPHFLAEKNNSTADYPATNQSETAVKDAENVWISKPASELPSVVLFLFGMVAARFGLWMLDLTITQTIQEDVSERERGVIGGVQSSFNRFMDMLKFILVICLPYPQTFGILIIVSFIFVTVGHCFYALHSYRRRGHLLPGLFGKHSHRPVIVHPDSSLPAPSNTANNDSA